ncbi:DUF72 domain-containing protein [Gramella sp. AN32]|uniref:DUF72 domain-containing protein n=1 Tax=Christiangramia antarctica TaxID=2058158 RepID=A0ABW5X7U3_9FLAO|nr:DUF72 domain-containing protein [Gramella sp. AN32]MCM4157377.1 DUF72 domain-containing protein [Gramella sp. AN32]
MKFGKVDDPSIIDYTLPKTPKQTDDVLGEYKKSTFDDVRIGCAKWNKQELKNFYPRGTKNELTYYSSQFNSIELNASFYRMFPADQFKKWKKQSEPDFKFFPKVPRIISHIKRLKDSEELSKDFVSNTLPLKEKLGMNFLQLRDDFGPKNMERLENFFHHWPKNAPLAAEFRHPEWYEDKDIEKELNQILMKYNITHVITDSAGRRDIIHMSLTTPTAFIRYNGANHASDYTRLDDWLDRLEDWHTKGLKNVYFFIHQNIEMESPLLSAYFIENFNNRFGTAIKIPETLNK